MSPKPTRKRRHKPATLNERAEAFVREFANCCDLEEAQRRVGYKPHHGNARRILNDPRSAELLAQHKARADELAQIHLAWVLGNLKRLAGGNMRDLVDVLDDGSFRVNLGKVSREQFYAIQELGFDTEGRVKVKMHDKVAPNRILKEHLSPAKSRVELTGKDGGPVQTLDLSKLTDEQVAVLERIMREASELGSDSSGSGSPSAVEGGASAA